MASFDTLAAQASAPSTGSDRNPEAGHIPLEEAAKRCRFGVVTALPKEMAAMRAMLDAKWDFQVADDPNEYVIGKIAARDGSGDHYVAVTLLKKMGNNSAASAATNLLRSFPTVQDVLMVGIAGGCPDPSRPSRHVRLGDIVVSNEYGVLQYDNVKLAKGRIEVRDTSQRPSAVLIQRVKRLETERIEGEYPWEAHILRGRNLESAKRPAASTDRLSPAGQSGKTVKHPRDPNRRSGQPKLHYGRIGSANTLLKDAKYRDALRDKHDVRAVEMEGSGIADGTWEFSQSYILIRGICDYGDSNKNDIWQGYAAVAAAAYARSLIESFPAPADSPESSTSEVIEEAPLAISSASTAEALSERIADFLAAELSLTAFALFIDEGAKRLHLAMVARARTEYELQREILAVARGFRVATSVVQSVWISLQQSTPPLVAYSDFYPTQLTAIGSYGDFFRFANGFLGDRDFWASLVFHSPSGIGEITFDNEEVDFPFIGGLA